jgi:hypothetical protein
VIPKTASIVNVRLALSTVCCGVPESITLKVSAPELAAVGVPLITPVDVFRLNVLGSVPVSIDQV